MTEWTSRLIALQDVLLHIFPRELLPIINWYIKAPMHEWEIVEPPPSATVTQTRVELTSSREHFSVLSKYWIEDGPYAWSIKCHTANPPPIAHWWVDQIVLGVFTVDIFGGVKQTTLAYITKDALVIPSDVASSYWPLGNNSSSEIVIRVDPVSHSITTSDANNRKATMTICYPWVSCRPYVRLSGTASVELMY
jgi:hypothetical protein